MVEEAGTGISENFSGCPLQAGLMVGEWAQSLGSVEPKFCADVSMPYFSALTLTGHLIASAAPHSNSQVPGLLLSCVLFQCRKDPFVGYTTTSIDWLSHVAFNCLLTALCLSLSL